MKTGDFFVYRAEGHVYLLLPDFTIGKVRIWVTGAGIHAMDERYLGYWDRANMPLDLIRQLTRFVKLFRGREIAERRNAMFRKERKPKF